MKKVLVQQPQFLPWIGFWHKFFSANLYIVYAGVKFDISDHQHRVTIDGKWLTLPIAKHQRNSLIKDVRLAEGASLQSIADKLQSRFGKCPFFHRLYPLLGYLERTTQPRFLLDILMSTTYWLGSILDNEPPIQSPRMIIDKVVRDGTKTEKLDRLFLDHRADTGENFVYLSGRGALDYMTKDSLQTPKEVLFQVFDRDGLSPDSIIELIVMHPNPKSVIFSCASWE